VNVQIGLMGPEGDHPARRERKRLSVGDTGPITKRGAAETARPLHRGGSGPLDHEGKHRALGASIAPYDSCGGVF